MKLLSYLSYPILSYLPHENVCNQCQAITHSLAFLIRHQSQSSTHVTARQGPPTPLGCYNFGGSSGFITATLSSVQIRNPGIGNLKNMSMLVILTKSVVFLWCVLTWLCGVGGRQVCVVEAHESAGDGVVNTEEPQISVAVQNSLKLRRRNVLMISPDGDGQSDSTSVNLISCSPE